MSLRAPLPADTRIIDSFGACGRPAGRPEARVLIALMKSQKQVFHRAKEVLFHEGASADNVFLLASGAVRLYRFLPNGRRVISRFLLGQDVVGLSYDDAYTFTAECITPTTVYKLARSHLNSLCAHSPALQSDIVLMLKHELMIERDDMLPMMHQAADARVARLLRIIAARKGVDCKSGERIQLSMSRSDIADFLGITIETVCRSFAKLKEEGLISASLPDWIRFEDAERLTSLAEGER